MKKHNGYLLKIFLAALLCAVSIFSAGCSKVPTTDLPPVTVNNYEYDSKSDYFTDSSSGETKFITVVDGNISEATNFYCHRTVTYKDLNYKVDFTFTKINGKLVAADLQNEENNSYFVKVPPEQDKGVFVCVTTLTSNFYPLFYDVRNCSFKDVLEGTGADELWISDFTASPDLKRFLLVSDKDETVYYCDPHEKNLSDMKVLTGVHDLSGAIWGSSKSLILTKTNENGFLETWIYDIETGKTEKTTDKYTLFTEETKCGIILYDSRYALNITEKGSIQSVDLLTGSEKTISGYTYDENCSLDRFTHNGGTLLLVSKTDTKNSIRTAYLLNLAESKILKQRDIPTEYVNVAYFDENNLIAYSSENTYSVYPLSE